MKRNFNSYADYYEALPEEVFFAALHTLLQHGKQREATDSRDRIIAPLTLALVFTKNFGLERITGDVTALVDYRLSLEELLTRVDEYVTESSIAVIESSEGR